MTKPPLHPIEAQHEQEIQRQSETRLRLIIESAPYAMIIANQEGKISFINAQTEKTFGYTRKELVGQAIEILIPESFRSRHTRDRQAFNHQPVIRPMGMGRDLFGLKKDGSQVPVEIGLTPMNSAEGPQVLASIIDITERKRMETERHRLEREVLEASEMERKRIGQELHDSLGQQLLGIAFLSDALKEKLHQKSLADAADAANIAGLIEKVMTQARELSRGLYAAELETQGLGEALNQLVSNMNATTSIHCRFLSDGDIDIKDMAKATHLYRIAQEALHNARRHSMATEMSVSARHKEDCFTLTIQDNGVGFSTGAQTAGMGLKTMRYRADIIGGTFDIRENEKGGTIISCTVPLKKTEL